MGRQRRLIVKQNARTGKVETQPLDVVSTGPGLEMVIDGSRLQIRLRDKLNLLALANANLHLRVLHPDGTVSASKFLNSRAAKNAGRRP